VPLLGHYAQVSESLADAGQIAASTSADAARRVPYDRITAQPGRVDLGLLRSVVAPFSDADHGLRTAADEVDRLDTSWLIPALNDRLTTYRNHLNSNLPEADRALEAVRLAPTLLGSGSTRHYLLLFANPAESRTLGGYAGAYGELTAAGGRLTLTRSGRTQDLPSGAPSDPAAVTGLGWPTSLYTPAALPGNVTAGGSFPAVARAAMSIFGPKLDTTVDGVIYVDPRGLAALLGLVGSVRVDGVDEPLTEQNVAQFLQQGQYETFPERSERFDFLSATAHDTFQLLTTRSLPSPVKIFEQLDPAVQGGHVLAYFDDRAASSLLAEVGASGGTTRPAGSQLLDLRTSNLSQNKTDAFLHRTVDYRASIDRTGAVDADVTVRLTNDAPLQLGPYVLSNRWLRQRLPGAPPYGSDTLLLSLTSSMVPGRASVDGAPIHLTRVVTGGGPASDQASDRYETTVTVPAGATVVVRLQLRGRPPSRGRWGLTIVHQPLANDDRVHVSFEQGSRTRAFGPFTLTDTRTVWFRAT
jgi:hypothetical protein